MSLMKRLFPEPPMYLVDDDTLEVAVTPSGKKSAYRLRVWRGRDTAPVVLASMVPGGSPPSWALRKLAHRAWSVYLGYTPRPWLFYTAEPTERGPVLMGHVFDWVGRNPYRSVPRSTVSVRADWLDFLAAVGEEHVSVSGG